MTEDIRIDAKSDSDEDGQMPERPRRLQRPRRPKRRETQTKNARVNPHANKIPMHSFKIKNQPSQSTSESTRPTMSLRKPFRYKIHERPEGCRQQRVLLAAAVWDVKWQRILELMQKTWHTTRGAGAKRVHEHKNKVGTFKAG